MKAKVFFLLMILIFILSCTQQKSSPLEGTWELISGKYIGTDTTINYPASEQGKHWKIITRNHFATIYQDTTSNLFLSKGFNGGTYTFVDSLYIENFTFSSISNKQIGQKMLFKVKLEGDKLNISSCSEDGTILDHGNFEEYKRLD